MTHLCTTHRYSNTSLNNTFSYTSQNNTLFSHHYMFHKLNFFRHLIHARLNYIFYSIRCLTSIIKNFQVPVN